MCKRFIERIRPGEVVAHFKREISDVASNPNIYLYRVLEFATHSETREKYVVYQAMYTDKKTGIEIGDVYVRPYDMFMSEVDREKYPNIKQKYRFESVVRR